MSKCTGEICTWQPQRNDAVEGFKYCLACMHQNDADIRRTIAHVKYKRFASTLNKPRARVSIFQRVINWFKS